MTPEVFSFDPPRDRPVPTQIAGHTLQGDAVTLSLEALTLIVAIKSSCDGCHDFVHSDLDELSGVAVIVVSAGGDPDGEWTNAVQRVIVAPQTLAALDIRWPPFYVLVDPLMKRIVTEGVVFAPAQVAREIAPHLT